MDFFDAQDTNPMIQKMLPKVAFDKTAFVKFKISNNSKQNIDETHIQNNQKSIGKSIPAYGFKKSQSENQTSRNYFQNVCDFQKEICSLV